MIELNERNKRALVILAVFIVSILILNFLILPVFNSFEKVQKQISIKERQLDEMIELENIVKLYKYKSIITGTGVKTKDFSLYSFMYNLAGKCGLKENINYIKPSSINNKKRGITGTLVEIELKNVPMEQFTKLLYETEYSDMGLNIRKLSINKSGSAKQGMHIIMHVEYLKA